MFNQYSWDKIMRYDIKLSENILLPIFWDESVDNKQRERSCTVSTITVPCSVDPSGKSCYTSYSYNQLILIR